MNERVYLYMMRAMDDALKELMEPAEYNIFMARIARKAFRMDVDAMADGEFKDFILDNFDDITREPYEAD